MVVQKFRGQKRRNVLLFLFVTQIKLSHNITELVFVFYFHSVFKLQQGVLHSRNKTGLPNLFFFCCFFQFTSRISSLSIYFHNLDVIPVSIVPTSQLIKSHARFEARSNKHYQEKYTECTYKHKNYLYIFIYIRSIPREWGENYAQTKLP